MDIMKPIKKVEIPIDNSRVTRKEIANYYIQKIKNVFKKYLDKYNGIKY